MFVDASLFHFLKYWREFHSFGIIRKQIHINETRANTTPHFEWSRMWFNVNVHSVCFSSRPYWGSSFFFCFSSFYDCKHLSKWIRPFVALVSKVSRFSVQWSLDGQFVTQFDCLKPGWSRGLRQKLLALLRWKPFEGLFTFFSGNNCIIWEDNACSIVSLKSHLVAGVISCSLSLLLSTSGSSLSRHSNWSEGNSECFTEESSKAGIWIFSSLVSWRKILGRVGAADSVQAL